MFELLQNQYIQIVLILLGSLLVAKILKEIVLVFLKKITTKTKTDLDDIIISIVSKPLYLSVFLLGLHFSLKVMKIVNGYTAMVNKLFFVAYVLIITYVIAKIINELVVRWFKQKKQFKQTPRLITSIINVVVFVIGILIILAFFQVEITPILATVGIGSIAIGLALQKTLENMFAGLHIISDEPVKVGDYIEIGSQVAGYVQDIGWRSTRIKTLGRDIIILPNSVLAESTIKNLSQFDQTTGAIIECGVDYLSDLEKVETVVLEVADEIQKSFEGAVIGFSPSMRFTQFSDSNINFKVFLRAENRKKKVPMEHEFIKALKKRFDQEKIEISWPVVKVVNTDK